MSAPEPQISVVVPAFNCAPYIGRALESVLRQVDSSVEVIVVDDGSTDGTATVLADYIPRIRVIRQHNQGVAAARNHAIAEARGTWIAFLDSDDVWRGDRLRVGRAICAAAPNAALVFSSFSLVDEQDRCL